MVSETVLVVLADIFGWGYFLAWTVSFYPQIYENWRRKCVVGLSFDMMTYFMISYIAYMIYNVVVFFDLNIQWEIIGNSNESSPVKLTDVVFAILGLVCTGITCLQCVIYESGPQKIHFTTKVVFSVFVVALGICCALAGFKVTSWLFMLDYCGYVKLAVSFGSYLPQIWLNYRRKCTEGFHIGGVLLDFSGGILSLLQMNIYCALEHSTKQFTGNIPKLVLGILTLVFNITLVLQHYMLYMGNPPPVLAPDSTEKTDLMKKLPTW
ncbi:predicted protein [Nematostella vectensis]|uniref:Cystinosin homolog n=1 Tax=Nematostella vectensis TaxID=45351 RepID=A7SMR9_NEMVE|nr:predicted protein [Nematostella vectensis]|eukprot:XP_001627087.1 predicted protein [Nematostella vectensis]